jgi:CheY-like chemotaxis protein
MNEPANTPIKGDASAIVSRALVVEDNLTNQAIIGAILQSLEFDISFANDGAQAVEAVRSEQFDIILMDIQMPVMDGFSATREIRDLGGWCACVPIIAVTANDMARDRSEYIKAGLDDLVPKPIDMRYFAETVHRHLSKAAN